jgi:peptide/nickel transport system permease protein
MLAYILRRIFIAVPVLFGVSVLAFLLVRAVPGDTVTALLGPYYGQEQAAMLRQRYGLDRPLAAQYGIWIGRVVRGDLGESTFTSEPVTRAILDRLPVTLELMLLSMIFAVVVGVPLGIVGALRASRPAGYAAGLFGLIGLSVPGFWLGTLCILLFSVSWRWVPSGGFVALSQGLGANLQSMAFPALSLGMAVCAVVMRMTRSSVLEVVRQDFVRTARAKGNRPIVVVVKHVLRNALVPVVTIIGLQAGYLLGGSVVIEQVFRLPGIGRLALQAINGRDYALLQGVILLVAAGFVVINLLVDVMYSLLDPRIRYE